MKVNRNSLIGVRLMFPVCGTVFSHAFDSYLCKSLKLITIKYPLTTRALHLNDTLEEISVQEHPTDSIGVFRKWGCSDSDISKIFLRRPGLRNANPHNLQFKLNILHNLGLSSSDLVKIINCRPQFLNRRINLFVDERREYLEALFGSKETLLKAIIRNPSLLTYDLHSRIKPIISLYEEMGISKKDLTSMLISRPTLIPRSSLNEEKLEYIRKTGVSANSRMYKYVVALIAISRLETIREKVGNFQKFGILEGEVLSLFGRSPVVLSLSVDKVQRNMTFVIGTLKLPASVVLDFPFLLLYNRDTTLKPRFLVAEKIQDMGLSPQIKGPSMLRALRMEEKRFLSTFVNCHSEYVAKVLMDYYRNVQGIKRLAEGSKKNLHRGFPF